MFDRFTGATRQVVLDAVREAEHARTERITAEHLLLALLRDTTRSAPILTGAGVTRENAVAEFAAARRRGGLTDAEAGALGELGIDVDAVVERIERAHGENALAAAPRRRSFRFVSGHRPFSGEARDVLAGAIDQARELRDRRIGDEHLLLALAAGTGVAAQVLANHGLSYPQVRARVARAG